MEEWISTKEEHVIYGLPEGSYTLHEELAPYEDGYVSASDVTFEVKEDGSVTKVEMKDEYSKVEISKTDLTTGKELEGAKLQIIRKDGTVLEEWITDGKPHSVAKLPVNEELTLREITAPDGYEIAKMLHHIERYNGSPESRNERCQNTGENNRKNKCTKNR